MRKGGGKSKGSAFEREICKALSWWVSHGKREDLFWRSAMSGGRATVGKRKGLDLAQHAGDISATHPLGHLLTDFWYVECKRYHDLKIESAILEGIGPLMKFWREACEQATAHKKMPMMIVRQDRRETLLIVAAPYHLTMGHGMTAFTFKALIARSHIMSADFYDFDKVVAAEFKAKATSPEHEVFLKPGELARILGTQEKPTRERVRLKKKSKRVRL